MDFCNRHQIVRIYIVYLTYKVLVLFRQGRHYDVRNSHGLSIFYTLYSNCYVSLFTASSLGQESLAGLPTSHANEPWTQLPESQHGDQLFAATTQGYCLRPF